MIARQADFAGYFDQLCFRECRCVLGAAAARLEFCGSRQHTLDRAARDRRRFLGEGWQGQIPLTATAIWRSMESSMPSRKGKAAAKLAARSGPALRPVARR